MGLKLSKEQYAILQKNGATARLLKEAKAAPAPAPAPPRDNTMAIMQAMKEAILASRPQSRPPEPPLSYNFTVKRDARGNIESMRADPIKR